jgi:hypothetical protein
LDPFASHVWGFMYRVDDSAVWSNYHASQELDWRATTETGPGYFGTASTTVSSLANKVANDERFVGCAVRRAFEGLMGRPATLDDDGALADHREVFLRSGLSMKALLKDIVHSPTYRGRAAHPHFGGQPAPVAHKTISPELLHTELLALTGVSVVVDGREALFVDHGLRALAGGSDRGSAALPSTGLVLAQRVLAENAANRLLDALGAEAGTVEEGATGDDVNLDSVLGQFLRSVDVQQRPTAEQAQRLLTLTTGRTLTSDDASALLALYDDVEALSPNGGWSALLTVALADPDLLLY